MHDVSFRGVRTWQRSQTDVATCQRDDQPCADKSPYLSDEDPCFEVGQQTVNTTGYEANVWLPCSRLDVRVWDKMFHHVWEQLAPLVRR